MDGTDSARDEEVPADIDDDLREPAQGAGLHRELTPPKMRFPC